MRSLLLASLLFLVPGIAFAWEGFVVGITDGDTIKVLRASDRTEVKVRLYGIDCPEKKQAFGKRAKQAASELSYKQTVEVEELACDFFGRIIANVYLSDGRCLNVELLRRGMAWVFPKYCRREECARWYEVEATAKDGAVGLWADSQAMPPWKWRKAFTDRTQRKSTK